MTIHGGFEMDDYQDYLDTVALDSFRYWIQKFLDEKGVDPKSDVEQSLGSNSDE
jgi:hypothetical protein